METHRPAINTVHHHPAYCLLPKISYTYTLTRSKHARKDSIPGEELCEIGFDITQQNHLHLVVCAGNKKNSIVRASKPLNDRKGCKIPKVQKLHRYYLADVHCSALSRK